MQKKQRRQRDAMGGRVFVNKRGAGRVRAKQSEQHESAPRAPRAPSAPAAAPAPAQLTEPSEPAEPDKKADTCSVPEPDSATMSSRVLGIDFGTTNTVVAVVMEDGVIEVLANDFWDRKTPSVVHIDPTDPSEHQVGEAALKLGLKDPQNTIRNVKRVLGFPPEAARFITALGPVRVLTSEHGECVTLKLSGDTKTTPEEVVAMILLELKKAAEHQLQETVSKAVIAVPSYFTAAQRQAVRDAAALADLEVVEIVNETTAAALAYAYDKEYSKTALIVDVGGGGCCISVVRVENNEVSVLACSTRQPGGENFDAKMVNYLKKVVVEQHKKVVVDTRSEEILRSLWVGAKAKLSRFPQTSIQTYLPEIGTEFHKPLTQAEFNSECSDLFQHITTAIHATIKRAQVEANKLDDVILVGGSTRIVKLRELIIEAVGGGVKLHKAVNPGEVVAQGAALLGAKCVQIKREVLGLHTYMTIMDSEKQEANEHWAHSTPLPVSVAFKSLSMTNCKELEMRQGYETKTLMTVCRLPIPQKAESITIDTQGTFSFLDARKNKLCGSYLRGCLPESMKAVKKRDIERKAAYKNAERAVLEGLNLKVAEFEAVTSEAFDFVEMCEGLLEQLQENPCMNASDCAEVSSKVEKGLTNLRSMCLAEVDRRQRRESLLVFLETALKDGEPLRTFAQGLLTWLEQHPQADKEQLEEVRASVEDARRSLQEADKLAEATEAKRGQAALTMRRMTQRLGLQPSGAPTVQLGTTPEISPAIGIDLGTTTSMVAVYQKRTSEIIPNDAGQKTTPSYVFFTDTEEYVGEAAKEMANRNTLYDSKRLLGRRFADVQQNIEHWPFKVVNDGGVPKYEITRHGLPTMLTPEEVSAKILKAMKVTAEDSLKRSVEKAVITVPAYFNDSQRQATRSAARLAGLEVLELLNEPTAAAIAFGFDKVRDQTLLIFHLGRSTFDVTVLHICSNNYQIKAHGGDTHLGGQDFDAQLLEYVILDIRESLGIDLQRDREDDPELMHELRAECELVKRKLSTMPQSPINLFLNRYGKGYRKDIPRAFFEGLCLAQFRRAINILPEVLSEAKVTKDEIDEVVLVGGSTRIPKIRSMVQEFFDGKELSKSVNPEEAVALGAAIRAASLSGRAGAKRTE